MATLRSIHQWSIAHHPRWLIFPRIILGGLLCIKGIAFMSNATLVENLLSGYWAGDTHALEIIISWANMLGGFLIIIGLQTRIMCLIQLPILIGAVVFINAQKGGFVPQSELGLAILALLLTILFLIEGSGPLSLDAYFSHNKDRDSQGRNLP
ncbi:TQO small subunit DoxD [Flavitalea sp. BT771]|uniref:TQO small subunit DoxD n=1 Tax=Flavitalea sp. BT771 TaxID=3063329 RepID=UPI0026E3A0C2|nr:TQO small subunit DoxD [Flavitalea sp. BT771]MDO6435293.1 TQO small subunit DoxD [Flavitalea sp. BT771]MDV6224347.1 TQO small subunit DoxD [Flavitalea sp. BT771]